MENIMTRRLMTTAVLALVLPVGGAEGKNAKVEYDVHTGHFEKNNSGLKGDASYLAFTDKAGFDAVFGSAAVMGKKFNWVPKDAFDKKIVVAVIKRGDTPVDYKVEQVTAGDGTLYVQYTATAKGNAGGAAKFASPLIVSVDKGKYTSVEFIENGKKAGSATIGK
jgi:hypothetical protein